MTVRISHVPLRLATGAFVLNSGIGKLGADDDRAKGLHERAAIAYPVFERMDPRVFTTLLGVAEVGVGTALLVPVVPPGLAGLVLGAFSTGLLGLYLRVPGLRSEGSLRPTREGTAVAKDSWMAAIAAALVLDDLGDRLRRLGRRRPGRRAAARAR
jgi:hypothetical protein